MSKRVIVALTAICLLTALIIGVYQAKATQPMPVSPGFRAVTAGEELVPQELINMLGQDIALEILNQVLAYPNLSVELLTEVIRVESDFDPKAVSSEGALGLGQIMPETGRWAAGQLGIDGFTREMLFDPVVNIRITAFLLSWWLDRYDGNLEKALGAYNRGERGLARYTARYGTTRTEYAEKILLLLENINEHP